jgi:hypothetical protein
MKDGGATRGGSVTRDGGADGIVILVICCLTFDYIFYVGSHDCCGHIPPGFLDVTVVPPLPCCVSPPSHSLSSQLSSACRIHTTYHCRLIVIFMVGSRHRQCCCAPSPASSMLLSRSPPLSSLSHFTPSVPASTLYTAYCINLAHHHQG